MNDRTRAFYPETGEMMHGMTRTPQARPDRCRHCGALKMKPLSLTVPGICIIQKQVTRDDTNAE